jgi:hypothetical protein
MMHTIDFIRYAVILLKRARRALASYNNSDPLIEDITAFLVENGKESKFEEVKPPIKPFAMTSRNSSWKHRR